MPVGTGYEITTVMMSFIIVIYFNKTRKIAVFQDEILLLLVVMNSLTAICELIKYGMLALLGSKGVAAGTLTACSTGYFATHIMVLPLMCLYILSIAKSWRETSLRFKISFALPVILADLMVLTNLWTGHLFVYTSDGVYQRGKGIMFFYMIAGYYLVYLIGLIFAFRKYYSFSRKVIFAAVITMCSLSTLVQFLFPEQTLETTAVALGSLILLFFIQNPGAQIDRVTRAYSKKIFYSVMRHNCLFQNRRVLYVIMLDNLQKDDFNADYEKLDDALSQMVGFLRNLHTKCNVYRIDKYVFCTEISDLQDAMAEQILEEIRERFRQPWGYLECNLYLKAKIGRISIPGELHTIDQLLGVLDRMIMEEYTEETLRVEQFNLEELERAKKISDVLAQSMENRDFDMRYTPICCLKDRSIVGAEVTIRFYEDSLGYVYDDEILEFAEKAGHVANLGQLIFEHTCRTIGEENLEELGIDFICIQILPALCMLQGLSDKLIDIMEKYHVNPSSICLQISEAAIANAMGTFRENMERLAEKGVKFCLTGYGSGYTNISSIYDLPFSMIKFSRSFTQSALVNDRARITFECLLALSRELNLETRVPGIDDLDYFDMVSDMACDYVEGDYFFDQLDMTGFRHIMEDAAVQTEEKMEEAGNGV